MPVFSDTWFYVAYLDARDRHHVHVRRYANDLRRVQVTTRWVLAEVANALAANRARAGVAAFVRELESLPRVRIVGPSDELFEQGQRLYEARPDKHWSLTDCISFAVMEREGLREALTNDHHFEQAGFVPVFADPA